MNLAMHDPRKAGLDPVQSEALWARRPLRNNVAWRRYAELRWHRFVTRAENEIVVACNRRLPLASAVFPEVPEGGHHCRDCAASPLR